jgi:hypothetical protein
MVVGPNMVSTTHPLAVGRLDGARLLQLSVLVADSGTCSKLWGNDAPPFLYNLPATLGVEKNIG